MDGTKGRRIHTIPVMFVDGQQVVAFANIPQVLVSPVHLDVFHTSNLRLDVRARNITTRGFDLELETWSTTQIFRLKIQWMATDL